MRSDVVSSFLTRSDKILLGRRGKGTGTYRNRWAAISGYREGKSPRTQALREIKEETGIPSDQLRLERVGEPVYVDDHDNNRYWRVFPFRFALIGKFEPRTDEEHVEFRWVSPDEISRLRTVPCLGATWHRVS